MGLASPDEPHGGDHQGFNDYLGFIPLFNNNEIGIYTKSIFIASVVLAIMILPTISALSREVFIQVPRDHREASLALGATRWEMIRMAVLPFGRPGIISATMLGLGRALGETIAVALILSAAFETNWHITEPGGNTFAANIALKWNEAGPIGLGVDRQRSDSVHHHSGGQHDRPCDHRQATRNSPERTHERDGQGRRGGPEGLSSQLAMRTLPRLGTLYSALIAAAITAVIVVVTPAAGIAGSLVIWYLIHAGPDRLEFPHRGAPVRGRPARHHLVWTAFL